MAGQRLFVVMLSLAASACSFIAPAPPTKDELLAALASEFPGNPILDSALFDCQEGASDEEPVQVCNFCIVAMHLKYSESAFERGGDLWTTRFAGNAAFRRAISSDQPDIAPGRGQRGVYVMVSSTLNLEESAGADEVTGAMLRPEEEERVGYRRRIGWSAWNSAWGSMGGALGRPVPDEVAARVSSDPELRTALMHDALWCSPQP